ncbi:hypothetical protein HUJ04_001983 [Dendroctonus ponderosae]|nr:hypothetical protein HUJ04_001983 [Dendroctonus ponderosae]
MAYNAREVFTLRESRDFNEDTAEQSAAELNGGIFLCLLNKNGTLGAAYYNFMDKTLNVYEEMVDLAPQFVITATLCREIAPKYVLTFGYITEEYVKMCVDCFSSETDTTTSNISRLPDNFFLVSMKEYTYEACKTIVSNINVASNTLDNGDHKQEVYFRSCINLNHRLSVQALGALYKYLEKHWSMFGVDPADQHFLHIHQVTLKNHVLLDNHTFKALQIFSQKSHDAGFKRGQDSSSREGLSVYRLFMSSCKSRMGQTELRNLLLSPINDRRELEKRLSFIKFVQQPVNLDFIASIHDNIKQFQNVVHVSAILGKILNARASNKDWKMLHKMIYHTIFINDISKGYRGKSELLAELDQAVTNNLLGLEESISNALDFNAGNKKGRPVIKFGLDENLDAKLLHQQDVSKHVTAAARFAANDLPDFIDECKVVYLPEMGHLMVIKRWEPDCDPEQLESLGYQFMFALGGVLHYKNPLCVELDKRLGDINAEIIDHENRILRRLSAFTLKYNKDIRQALKAVAIIDCLIAMAKVSQQNNYVKPELNDLRIQEIEECRHPLMEQILNSFEANDFKSGGLHSHMKIITGANGSGKSIFLKQILLAVYLAHVGCYIPAKKANIGLVDSMHCLIQTKESAVVRLSSFMMDVTQTSQVIHCASPSSLIIMDEFGRGTLEDDGLILLVSFLNHFLSKGELCPHILVSTHFQRISTMLPESQYLEYLKMNHTVENGTFCFLHKMAAGVSDSYAFDIASAILSPDRIGRAKQYFQWIQRNERGELPEETLKIQNQYVFDNLNVELISEDSNDNN